MPVMSGPSLKPEWSGCRFPAGLQLVVVAQAVLVVPVQVYVVCAFPTVTESKRIITMNEIRSKIGVFIIVKLGGLTIKNEYSSRLFSPEPVI